MQVRSDYEQLRRTFVLVRRERDAARQDRTHLQIKVEKLEEVLKVWSASKTLLLYVTVCNTFLTVRSARTEAWYLTSVFLLIMF